MAKKIQNTQPVDIELLKRRKKQNKFINVLIKNNYHLTNTCKDLRMARNDYYKWLKEEDGIFAAYIEQMREQEVDVIEDAFRGLIEEKNPQAVIFGLKTRGAHKGYQEKQQVEHFGAAGIKVMMVEPSDEKREDKEDDV